MRLRGRKGIREDLEQQRDLVVLDPREYKGRWAEAFGNGRPIHIELGMGKGQFISGMSVKYPEVNFIGMDMYDELIRRAGEKVRAIWREQGAERPENVRLALGNVESLEEFFAPGEVERIYLNFSDPWPKKKHWRRRLTHPRFLDKYRALLNERGEIHFKTDSRILFEFSLNSFAACGLQMSDISLSLHEGGVNEGHVMTEYESKFVGQGLPIYRCEVIVGEAALQRYHEHKLERF
ncbi:MAG: tRNA (guanosine(46)-N7)-methyltransferase TrmB [Paenibacillus macerans]|uniref:tRNA (guanine-N(7)-)-methyltransferase n=1 Tax=Paenibacillus macerans TaxID=44252 RepID=A0A090ZCK6_PAEMA|nr:tRNA (guanosine(46)-N7)-methyltransferase TrmB [Paenibacillus macerans]KFN07960.1 tRNA (guanine-N(7)-)-methyltransferase [Paenibacillus macerans]MCY7556840.1 tRNA (guanosine(46)-N7)-methyltransferase TrmB [Paenibacillus macerans]MDU7475165.1 tRNA (guanosine(46)-N7)-methyltransferase TrmB [Paenibacillus macerans]MEC0152013.1 tRNA (guanosine(46)-N7)-methyltransferase TrmB [Paenibacillus macerans]MEC0328529.1 tRNA (guanosine(46)-N7)-methyltransferase TrmB [Paenibacillus macerans]